MAVKKKKDYTVNAAEATPINETIETVTATPTPKEIERRSRDKEYTAEEIQLAREQGRTRGRKGVKALRINVAFTPANHEYLTIMSRVRGESLTDFLNYIISQSLVDHREIYEKAKVFIEEFD